jgi:endogenous inhibitor of DNA gyrase (YacG/DUF329 family)
MFDKTDALMLYPEYDTVYGPYVGPDERKRVVFKKSGARTNITTTVSYPKLLKEIELGRRLSDNETVDHDDRDKKNDDPSNLKILDRSNHASLDARRVKVEPIPCPICDFVFVPNINQRNISTKAGPFCSKRCAGIYSSNIKNGSEKMQRVELVKSYYRVDK